MEHYKKEKKDTTTNEETNIDLGFQKLINTALAQINNNE